MLPGHKLASRALLVDSMMTVPVIAQVLCFGRGWASLHRTAARASSQGKEGPRRLLEDLPLELAKRLPAVGCRLAVPTTTSRARPANGIDADMTLRELWPLCVGPHSSPLPFAR